MATGPRLRLPQADGFVLPDHLEKDLTMSMPFYSLSRGAMLSTLLQWEANPDYSREAVTLLAGDGGERRVEVGTILANLVNAAGATVEASADAGNTGDGVLTMEASPVTSAVREGVYVVVCIDPAADGGTFDVQDPAGKSVGTATVGALFGKQVRFTISDGAADFVAGDRFEISVARASAASNAGKVVAWDPEASDGSQVIWGIALNEAVAPVGEDLVGGLVGLRRLALVKERGIAWPDGVSDRQKALAIEDLEALGVVVRTS